MRVLFLFPLTACWEHVEFEDSADESGAPDSSESATPDSDDSDPPHTGEGEGEGEGEVTPSWSWGTRVGVESADASLVGEVAGDDAGARLSVLGDVNGDAVDDLAVGAPFSNEGAEEGGKVYFVMGRTTGWTPDEPLAAHPSVVGDQDGHQLSGATPLGDVNGDGLADTALYFGYNIVMDRNDLPLMLGNDGTWTSSLPSSEADILIHNSVEDVGTVIQTLGDLDGDGLDDVPVWEQGNNYGQTFVVSGADLGATTTIPEDASWWAHGDGDASLYAFTGADLNGDGLADLAGENYNPRGQNLDVLLFFGSSGALPYDELANDAAGTRILVEQVSGSSERVHDVNGDGTDELTVSATYLYDGATDAIGTRLFFGRSDWPDTMELDDADVSITGGTTLFPSTVGDLDGDGFGDLAILHQEPDGGVASVYVALGREDWPAELALEDADVHVTAGDELTMNMREPWPRLVGDLSCDGRDELMVPVPYTDIDGVERAGALYVFRGRTWTTAELSTDDADFTLVGTEPYQSQGSEILLAMGDLNGDGCDDLVASSSRHPVSAEGDSAEGTAFLFFGQPAP